MATRVLLSLMVLICLTLTECVVKDNKIQTISHLLPRNPVYYGDISSVHVSSNGETVAELNSLGSVQHQLGSIQQALGVAQQAIGSSQYAAGTGQQAIGASQQALSLTQQALGMAQQAQSLGLGGAQQALLNAQLATGQSGQVLGQLGQQFSNMYNNQVTVPSTTAPSYYATQKPPSTSAPHKSTTGTGHWAAHPVPSATCHDNIPTCVSYGPDICMKYPEWAKQQCAQFCVYCINTASSTSTLMMKKPTTTTPSKVTHGNGGAIP